MVAPFDFGYPVNLKLQGIEENIEFDEIIAPSISINFGVKKAPIAWGIVVQKGRKFDETSVPDTRVMAHISFDMPLFVF